MGIILSHLEKGMAPEEDLVNVLERDAGFTNEVLERMKGLGLVEGKDGRYRARPAR